MDEIREQLWKEEQRSFLSTDVRLLTEPITLDNNLAQLCLQSTKLNFIEQNTNDVFILWLTNEDEKEDQLVNGINIKLFHSNATLIDFISELQTSNVFLIIDHVLVSNILSFLDNFFQIIFTYVLTNEESNNTVIITDAKRSIRQISNDKEELFRFINDDIDTCIKDSICSTIFELNTTEESTNQTKNTSFIWYYLLIESLFDITVHNNKAKKDLIEYCRQQYSINNNQQNAITQFETDYSADNAIRWYTRDSFIYRQLNKALRTRDIDAIFKFRFFIIDFQKQLEQHYNEQTIESLQTVYRGQQISQLELIKLKNSLGKYISFNTYLSASIQKEVALIYADGILPVLFEIEASFTADLKNKRIRPVYVQDKSYFPEEFEVIFPIGSTFHVDSVWMEDQRCHIKLKLTNDNDYNHMTDLIQAIYMKNIPTKVNFANLLVSLGDYEKAEQYIEMLIEDLELSSDNVNIGYAYDLLGQTWSGRGDYQCALPYFEKALYNIDSENVYRATIYRHMGDLYCEKTEFDIALKYLNQALEYEQEMDPLELAELYEAFGSVYREMKNLDNALTHVNQALNIRQSNLSAVNVLGFTYASLAWIYAAKYDYMEALRLFKLALNSYSEIFPKDHPIFVALYAFTGLMCLQCQDWSSANIYSEKAIHLIKIAEQKQNFKPVIHIRTCTILVQLYTVKEDLSNAFYYAQEAYNIYIRFKHTIPAASATIKMIYIDLGTAYHNLCDFSSALTFFFKALNHCQEDISDQILILNSIGSVYLHQEDTKRALHYFNNSLELNSQRIQPIVNDTTSFWINYHICEVYIHENNLEKSVFFVREALRLVFEQTHKNFQLIILCYTKLMRLCPEEKKEYIGEILEIVQKHDLQIRVKIFCHNIIGHYYTQQKQFFNALHHYELCLKYHLTRIPSCYEELISIYLNIGDTYRMIKREDLDIPLFYYEKSRDIYLELLNKAEIPTNDKRSMFSFEGYILENINQSSSLIFIVLSIYQSITDCYIKKENYEKALDHLHKIEQILSEYNGKKQLISQDTTYCLIGYSYYVMQYYDKAIFFYEKSLAYISAVYNKYGLTYFCIARIYYEKNDYLMAISKCKICLTFLHNSQSIDHNMLAQCYKFLSFSYKNIKNDEYTFIFSEQAIRYYLLCNPINYDNIISFYLESVDVIYSLKPWDYKEPLKYLLPSIKFSQCDLKDDSLENLYFNFGYCYLLNRKYKTSLFYLNKSLEYSKKTKDILLSYKLQWLIYTLLGQFDTALNTVKKIINIRLNSETLDFVAISESYDNMGFIYYQIGKYKLALKYYKFAFYILEIYQNNRKHENYSLIYSDIAYIYFQYGQIKDALQFCLKARNIHLLTKNNRHITINIYILLALIECKLGNYYNALDYLGQVWEFIFNADIPYARASRILYNHIGYVYFKLGEIEIAMNNYFKSLSLYNDCQKHPNLAQVYKNIGLICEQNQKTYSLALLFYERALETLPNNKHPHYILYKSMIITLELKLKKNKNLIHN